MSQERTERESKYVRMMVGKIGTRGGEVGMDQAIAEAVALLNATINGQQEALEQQAAKVQEKDREIKRSSEIIEGQDEQINKQTEVIERLRGAGEHIIYEAVRMSENDWDEPSITFREKSVEWRAALKGAE